MGRARRLARRCRDAVDWGKLCRWPCTSTTGGLEGPAPRGRGPAPGRGGFALGPRTEGPPARTMGPHRAAHAIPLGGRRGAGRVCVAGPDRARAGAPTDCPARGAGSRRYACPATVTVPAFPSREAEGASPLPDPPHCPRPPASAATRRPAQLRDLVRCGPSPRHGHPSAEGDATTRSPPCLPASGRRAALVPPAGEALAMRSGGGEGGAYGRRPGGGGALRLVGGGRSGRAGMAVRGRATRPRHGRAVVVRWAWTRPVGARLAVSDPATGSPGGGRHRRTRDEEDGSAAGLGRSTEGADPHARPGEDKPVSCGIEQGGASWPWQAQRGSPPSRGRPAESSAIAPVPGRAGAYSGSRV